MNFISLYLLIIFGVASIIFVLNLNKLINYFKNKRKEKIVINNKKKPNSQFYTEVVKKINITYYKSNINWKKLLSKTFMGIIPIIVLFIMIKNIFNQINEVMQTSNTTSIGNQLAGSLNTLGSFGQTTVILALIGGGLFIGFLSVKNDLI